MQPEKPLCPLPDLALAVDEFLPPVAIVRTQEPRSRCAATQVTWLSNPPSNGDWSEGSLNVAGLAAVNTGGRTQLQIYFDLDDNDDGGNDYIAATA